MDTCLRPCRWVAAVTVLLVLVVSRLPAQQIHAAQTRSPWAAAPMPLGAPLSLPAPYSLGESARLRDTSSEISWARVAGGALVGGVLGAGALAGTGALLGGAVDGGGSIVPASYVFGVLGTAVGYSVGAAVGARWGATARGRKPPLGGILLASLAGVAVGGLVWNRVGEIFEPDDPFVVDRTAWYVGAAAGVATHLAITSLVAHGEGTKEQRRADQPIVPSGHAPASDAALHADAGPCLFSSSQVCRSSERFTGRGVAPTGERER